MYKKRAVGAAHSYPDLFGVRELRPACATAAESLEEREKETVREKRARNARTG